MKTFDRVSIIYFIFSLSCFSYAGTSDLFNSDTIKIAPTMIVQSDAFAHADLNTVKFSPSGKYLVTGALGSVCVWNPSNRKLLHRVRALTYFSLPPIFSRNERFLATSFRPGIQIWDTRTWQLSREIKCAAIHAMAFSKDNKSLVFGPEGRSLRVCAVGGDHDSSIKSITNIALNDATIFTMSSDASRIFFTKSGNKIHVLDLSSGKIVASVVTRAKIVKLNSYKEGLLAFTENETTFAYSFGAKGDGLTLVSKLDGKRKFLPGLELYAKILRNLDDDGVHARKKEMQNDQQLLFNNRGERFVDFAYTHRSGLFVLATTGGMLRLFRVKLLDGGKISLRPELPIVPEITDFTATAHGRCFGTADGRIIFDTPAGKQQIIKAHREVIRVASFSNQKRIVSFGRDLTLKCWNSETLEKLFQLEGYYDYYFASAPKGNMVAIESASGKKVDILSMKEGVMVNEVRLKQKGAHSVSLSARGDLLCLCTAGRQIEVFNLHSNLKIWSMSTDEKEKFTWASISPDGCYVALQVNFKTMRFVRLGDKRILSEVGSSIIHGRSFSSTGGLFAQAVEQNTLDIFEVLSGQLILRMNVDVFIEKIVLSDAGTALILFDDHCFKTVDFKDVLINYAAKEKKTLRFEEVWSLLASKNAASAMGGVLSFAQRNQLSVPWLERQLTFKHSDNDYKMLVRLLDNEEYSKRADAKKKLVEHLPAIEPFLRKCLRDPKFVLPNGKAELRSILVEFDRSGLNVKKLQFQRALETLILIGTPKCVDIIKRLSGADGSAWQTKEAKIYLPRIRGR